MPGDEVFESAVRSSGDLAGIFEYDGDSGYFYLYSTEQGAGKKVLESIHILSGELDFSAHDVSVRWDRNEQRVGLFIRGELWAVFDGLDRSKLGGNYRAGAKSPLSEETALHFSRS